jgi:metallo-beta-lactamase class B
MKRMAGVVLVMNLLMLDAAGQSARPPEHEAFKIFDNLYYVGINFVSAYLVPTSEGLILIDTTYDNTAEHVMSGIREMGFDPKEIKYILVTHWHADHFGGAKRIQAVSGARVGMLREDWDDLASRTLIPEDWVIADGDVLTLGDTTMTFYHIPGHTRGTLGIAFTVYDNGTPHKAFTFGGAGLNFRGVERTEQYLNSVRRVMAMEGIEVNVANHENMGEVFKRYRRLTRRKPGDPHPFVDPAAFQAFLTGALANGEKKLAMEKNRAAR